MHNIEKLVRERRSFRTMDGNELAASDKEKLMAYADSIENPFGLKVEFRLLENMTSPVIVGTNLFLGAKMKDAPDSNIAFGYSFEKLVLFAQSMGIGTTWIGGTMDRDAFENAMELAADEIMPCVSPLGYPAKKMAFREVMMRKGVKADTRLRFEEIVFDGDFAHPMNADAAGKLFMPLEMVRLGPSAVNKQPWRMVVTKDAVHFYLKRSMKYNGEKLDMQKTDIGIALCHFELMAEECGIKTAFVVSDPKIACEDMEYIASYQYEL